MIFGFLGALVVIAALVAALVLWGSGGPGPPGADRPTPTDSPAPLRPAPAGVQLRDGGGTITVTWIDPSGGTVPFIVSVARAGEQARPFANLPVGSTAYTVNGLNPRLEYCITVVAVYSTEVFSASDLVCTRRAASATNPQPSRTR